MIKLKNILSGLKNMPNRDINIAVGALLLFVFVICLLSIRDDSLTMDELAHLPAGYSYLVRQDMRLNPEHPPLIKDLAAIPLLFIKDINFPDQIKSWTEDVNGQWDFGNQFLFHSGNPVDKMIFWSRIPMILVLIVGGLYTFLFGKEFFGAKIGLLALVLYSFSPTLLAHGRLVTTDVGIATGVIIAFYYFFKMLKKPTKKNVFLAGIGLGLALLLKFTGIFLVPCFIGFAVVWALLQAKKTENKKQVLWRYAISLFFLFLIAGLSIWPLYYFHVANYPVERQVRDMKFVLSSHPIQQLGPILTKMAQIKILRPYAQYLYGLAMVFQRGVGGNTTFFMGEISASGWKTYFPILYLAKETLTLHILTITGIISAAGILLKELIKAQKQSFKQLLAKLIEVFETRYIEWALFGFILFYWAISLLGNLNIGVRHLLPVFPLAFILISRDVVEDFLKNPGVKIKYAFLGVLILWQVISVISVYPHFIAYYNEFVGGPEKGYLIAADSNLDWGQDLKRLKKWVDANGIQEIYIDVFGGADARYYFQEKFRSWWGTRNPAEAKSGEYLAVSATFLQGGRGKPVPGFTQDYGYYLWLDNQELITTIGHSIFVYRIK